MFGLLFIYFIGKYFYELAKEFGKSQWGYAIAGVATYYLGGALLYFAVLLPLMFIMPDTIENMDDRDHGFLIVPFGIGACFLFYYLLKKRWQKEMPNTETIDAIGSEHEN